MASDVFNILYRIVANRMVSQGYEYGEAGVRSSTETYGVLETITTIEPQGNVEVAPHKHCALQRGLPLPQVLNQIVNCVWQKSRVELALAEDSSHWDVEVTPVESVEAATAAGSEGPHHQQCFEDGDERVRAGRPRVPRWLFAGDLHVSGEEHPLGPGQGLLLLPFPSDVQE